MPEGWTTAPLGEVCDFVNGKYLPKSEYVDGGPVEVHGAGGVMGYYSVPLDGRPLTVTGRIGTIGVVRYCPSGAWVNNNAMALTPRDTAVLDPRMLFLTVSRVEWSLVTGQTAQPFVKKEELQRLPVAFPPLKEQRRIVDLLACVDANILATSSVLETLRDLRGAALEELLTGVHTIPENYDAVL